MTLDRVHVDGIARLASAIARAVDDADHGDLAERVWEGFLDPLRDGSRIVAEPVAEKRLRSVTIDDVALAESPFETVHGLDSGTINPTTFKNGLVLDVAQAAMAGVPTDLDLHRARTLVVTVHANDPTVDFETDWIVDDDGYSRRKVLHAPSVDRYAEGVVHALSLYLAEGEHALLQADAVGDLLVLDGPLYPMEVFTWQDGDATLRELATETTPRDVVENYVRLVERFVERDVPLVGFVKNPASRFIVQALRKKGIEAPWSDDAALFTRLLERWDDEGQERRTDCLTFTDWFVSRGGTDRTMAVSGDALGVDRQLDPAAYEVAFFPLYDPRTDICYRVEAPAAFVRDADTRERLTQQVLHDVAVARGPPPAIAKADELARISQGEKAALRRKLETYLDSEVVRRHDEERWGLV
ncbi:DNA double-strand break repair nuclease NurA [Salinigranum salinum]|uniref:DNA double-strand break repair nuclease NurA n=1 Tax=Salinigranum salinum TaxID=1364937 RepID=UPI001260B9D2|nr:DNA double-strand break repair nuclease NurA [Salinigranum salinum]